MLTLGPYVIEDYPFNDPEVFETAMDVGNNGHWIADKTNATIREVGLVDAVFICLPGSGALTFVEYCVDPFVFESPPFGSRRERNLKDGGVPHFRRPWEDWVN